MLCTGSYVLYARVRAGGAVAVAIVFVVATVDVNDRLLLSNFCFTNMTFCNYNNVISCLLCSVIVASYPIVYFVFTGSLSFSSTIN